MYPINQSINGFLLKLLCDETHSYNSQQWVLFSTLPIILGIVFIQQSLACRNCTFQVLFSMGKINLAFFSVSYMSLQMEIQIFWGKTRVLWIICAFFGKNQQPCLRAITKFLRPCHLTGCFVVYKIIPQDNFQACFLYAFSLL